MNKNVENSNNNNNSTGLFYMYHLYIKKFHDNDDGNSDGGSNEFEI